MTHFWIGFVWFVIGAFVGAVAMSWFVAAGNDDMRAGRK